MNATLHPPAPTVPAAAPVQPRPLWRGRMMLLVSGLGMVVMSHLFSAEGPELLLLLGGGLLVFAMWTSLVVLGWRPALAATVLVIAGLYAGSFANRPLARQSYRMYVRHHQQELAEIVAVMRRVGPVEVVGRVRPPNVCAVPGVAAADCTVLERLMKGTGAFEAWRHGDVTVLEMYGWIDHRGGIRHCPGASAKRCAREGRRISGDWYRWDS